MYTRRAIFKLFKKCNVVLPNSAKQRRNLYSYRTEKNTSPPFVLPNISQYSSDSPLKCWNCKFAYKSELFCSKCKALQEPPENITYFDIMGIPKSYDVTVPEVHNKYRELQKMLHPDKFGNKSEIEKELSEKLSSLVNKAYSTLAHPLKRGLYLLELSNISIPEGTTNLNPEFLMEIMERNEQIEDAADDKDKVLKLMQENKEFLDTLTKEVADAFQNDDIEKAKLVLIKMKYYDSIDKRLKKLKHDLGIVE